MKMPKSVILRSFLFAFALVAIFLFFIYIPSNSFPSEDASMLFQYSENLSNGGGISYNFGGQPTEGATDFLWMIILSVCYHIGLNTYLSATILSALSLILSAYLLVRISGKSCSTKLLPLSMLALLAVPQVFAAIEGFSPFFFGAFILLTMVGFLESRPKLTFISAILTCLIRPDGVVFAMPIVAAFLLANKSDLKQNIIRVFFIAVLPGVIYFAWRFRYFDSLLPLPFYVKSNFPRFAGIFCLESLKLNFMFFVALAPVLAFAIYGIRSADKESRAMFWKVALCLLFVPFIFYSAMHLEQNIAYRFQYPFVLISLALASYGLKYVPRPGFGWIAVAGSIGLMLPWYAVESVRTLSMPSETMPYLSKDLRQLPCRGRIATTEAGRLPYYSGWKTVDLWGLNTKELARTLVTPQYIKSFNPDIVVCHPLGGYYGDDYRFITNTPQTVYTKRSWQNMLDNTCAGVKLGDYQLLMIPHLRTNMSKNPFAWVVPTRKKIQAKLGYTGTFATYYAFFVRRDYKCFDALIEILKKFGAIDFDSYQEQKKLFIANCEKVDK